LPLTGNKQDLAEVKTNEACLTARKNSTTDVREQMSGKEISQLSSTSILDMQVSEREEN